MRQIRRSLVVLFVLGIACAAAGPAVAGKKKRDASASKPSFPERLEKMERRDGFLVHYLDRERGKVWFEFPSAEAGSPRQEFLWIESLRAGLGSNPVGLDRGQLGATRWVRVREIGDKIFFELPNPRFRATTPNRLERRAVEDSFARSVVWAAPVAHRADDGRVWIDATPFLLRDAHGVVRRLARGGARVVLARRRLERRRSGGEPRVSEERRARSVADVSRRRAGARGAGDGGRSPRVHADRAPQLRPVARRRLRAPGP